MLKEILIFEKLSDEMVFYFYDTNVKLYKSCTTTPGEMETSTFYAVKRIISPQDQEKSAIDYMFDPEDRFFKLYRPDFGDYETGHDNILLSLTHSRNPYPLKKKVKSWRVAKNAFDFQAAFEIPVQKDDILKHQFFQNIQKESGFCEFFETISLGEMLDIDLD